MRFSRVWTAWLLVALMLTPALGAPRYDLAALKLRQRARGVVVAAMGEADSFVRGLAIRALADLEDRSAYPVLRPALLAEDRGIRYLAFRALYLVKDPAVAAALELGRRSRQGPDRVQTAWMVGEMADLFRRAKDERALAWLLQLARDPDDDVRTTALEALGKLADPGALPAARAGCRDKVAEARQYALETLGRIGEPADVELAAVGLRDTEPGVRRQAAITLARLGERAGDAGRDRAAAALAPVLRDADPYARAQAAASLAQLQPAQVARHQAALLAEPDTAVRLSAIEGLDAAGAAVWRAALRDQDQEVRFRAAQLLAAQGNRAGYEVLRAVLRESDWSLRLQAAAALADLGAATPLRQALADARPEVREAALKELARRPSRAAGDREGILDLLVQRLGDPRPPVRARAAEAIGLLEDRTSVPALTRLLADQHPMPRAAAAWAVLRLTR